MNAVVVDGARGKLLPGHVAPVFLYVSAPGVWPGCAVALLMGSKILWNWPSIVVWIKYMVCQSEAHVWLTEARPYTPVPVFCRHCPLHDDWFCGQHLGMQLVTGPLCRGRLQCGSYLDSTRHSSDHIMDLYSFTRPGLRIRKQPSSQWPMYGNLDW